MKGGGRPLRVKPLPLSESARYYEFAMRAQMEFVAPPWAEPGSIWKVWPRPPDLHIAGRVHDGVTGELKK